MFLLASTLKFLLSFALMLPYGNTLKVFPCRNNGTQAKKGNETFCICVSPYTGRHCEDYACVNGLSTGDQYNPTSPIFSKRCLCDAGWTGELCDESLFNRCGENGKEVKGNCVCEPNFVGDRCDFVTKCTHGQLYNGRCSCHYGWAGNFCDNIICHQGKADEKNQQCICPPKYRGKYCDFCAAPASTPPPDCDEIRGHRIISMNEENVQIIVLIVIFLIAFVVGGIVIYCVCYKISHANRNTRNTTADRESTPPENERETCPLNGINEAIGEGLKLDSEKFHDAPPPYETLTVTHAQIETKAVQELPDSGFIDSDDVTGGGSSTMSGAIKNNTEIRLSLQTINEAKQIHDSL